MFKLVSKVVGQLKSKLDQTHEGEGPDGEGSSTTTTNGHSHHQQTDSSNKLTLSSDHEEQEEEQSHKYALTKETMKEAFMIFSSADKLTSAEKALIIKFMAGNRGEMLIERFLQLNYTAGSWKKLEKVTKFIDGEVDDDGEGNFDVIDHNDSDEKDDKSHTNGHVEPADDHEVDFESQHSHGQQNKCYSYDGGHKHKNYQPKPWNHHTNLDDKESTTPDDKEDGNNYHDEQDVYRDDDVEEPSLYENEYVDADELENEVDIGRHNNNRPIFFDNRRNDD